MLLLTCKVEVIGLNGSIQQTRALLDSALFSFSIMKRLARQLHLPHSHHGSKVSGIHVGGAAVQSNHATVYFSVVHLSCWKELTRAGHITCTSQNQEKAPDMPSRSVPFNEKWKHLVGLPLAYSDFRVSRSIHILVGANILNHAVIQGPELGLPAPYRRLTLVFVGH